MYKISNAINPNTGILEIGHGTYKKEKDWKTELKEEVTDWKTLLKEDLDKEETPDQLLKKKIAFGDLRNYLNLYDELFKNNLYEEEIKSNLKQYKFYDIVFSIILREILKDSKVRFLHGKVSDVRDIIESDKKEILRNKNLFIFEKKGIANIDYDIKETDGLKVLKNELSAISVMKVLLLTDKFLNIPAKWNDDSLRRFFNIFDLILLDMDTIDKTLLDFKLLDYKINTTCNLIITQER